MPKHTLQTIFKEYECVNCSLIWYGQQHSINAHKKNKFGFGEKRKAKGILNLYQILIKLTTRGEFRNLSFLINNSFE